MSYSVIGILAIFIHLIINRDVLWHKETYDLVPAFKQYRAFIFGIIIFCVTDVLWGFLNEYHIIPALYIVTVFYFAAMMAGFLLWTQYVVAYMDSDTVLKKILSVAGIVLFGMELVILLINFFVPIQFWFDSNGVYHAGGARYVTLALQVILFLLTSIFTFATKAKTPEATKRLRRTVGYFGLAMASLIMLQWFYPLLPLYSIGYLLGSCLAHTFVVEDEKEEYRKTLEDMLKREQLHKQELGFAKKKIYTDPLTGAGSKQAYMDDAQRINDQIQSGDINEFAVAVFDLNDLKIINDTKGHDIGDIYIYNAGMLIGEFFSHSPVYRIGGDEFAAIIQGEDYENRETLIEQFYNRALENKKTGKVVVSSGIASYNPDTDENFVSVFERADKIMYECKKQLKNS